jgi:hypothetical protein
MLDIHTTQYLRLGIKIWTEIALTVILTEPNFSSRFLYSLLKRRYYLNT